MRFLVDEQLPAALARWLVSKGHAAEHVADRRMQAVPDGAVWDYALTHAATIITKDEDFAQRKVLTANGPTVVWIRLPNTRRQALLDWFETVLPEIVSALERGALSSFRHRQYVGAGIQRRGATAGVGERDQNDRTAAVQGGADEHATVI